MTRVVATEADGVVTVSVDDEPRYLLRVDQFQDLLDDMATRKLGRFSESFKRCETAASAVGGMPRAESLLLRSRTL